MDVRYVLHLSVYWGADYLKIDGCNERPSHLPADHEAFGEALANLSRPLVYSCEWPLYSQGADNYSAIAATCNLWRNGHDIQPHWESVVSVARLYALIQAEEFQFAGPGAWFDPDMLLVGAGALTLAQDRAQMALWAAWAAPLLMSNDLRALDPRDRALLQNAEVIAVDQDALGVMARLMTPTDASLQVWARPVLPAGSCAVAAVNLGEEDGSFSFTPAAAGCGNTTATYRVKELFSQADGGEVHAEDAVTGQVAAEDALLFTLTAQ